MNTSTESKTEYSPIGNMVLGAGLLSFLFAGCALIPFVQSHGSAGHLVAAGAFCLTGVVLFALGQIIRSLDEIKSRLSDHK